MAWMAPNDQQQTPTAWLALRQTTGLKQREVERRLGWAVDGTGHGRLSLIERGITPSAEEAAQLRAFYLTVQGEGPI